MPISHVFQSAKGDMPDSSMVRASNWNPSHVNAPTITSTATNLTLGASHEIVLVTAEATITLPTAVGIAGRRYVIKRTGSGTVTLATTASQTIDGASSHPLLGGVQARTLISNGSNWEIINADIVYAALDFETGAVPSPWTTSGSRVTVTTGSKKNGVYGGNIHYETSGSGHQGDDEFVVYDHGAPGIFHTFASAWYNLRTPVLTPASGDKLMYFSAGTFDGNDPWSVILSADDPAGSPWPGAGPVFMRWSQQNGNIGGSTYAIDCGTSGNPISGIGCALSYDTWYFIEMEILSNTYPGSGGPGAPWNGEVRVWVTPSGGATALVYVATEWDLNRTTTGYLRTFRFGEQVDTDGVASNQDRYIDDAAITNFYRGPT